MESLRAVKQIILAASLFGATRIASAASLTATPDTGGRPIPFSHGNELAMGALLFKAVVALGVTLLVGVGIIWALKRFFPSISLTEPQSAERQIKLVEHRRISPKVTVFLLEVKDSRYVFALSGDRITPLLPESRSD